MRPRKHSDIHHYVVLTFDATPTILPSPSAGAGNSIGGAGWFPFRMKNKIGGPCRAIELGESNGADTSRGGFHLFISIPRFHCIRQGGCKSFFFLIFRKFSRRLSGFGALFFAGFIPHWTIEAGRPPRNEFRAEIRRNRLKTVGERRHFLGNRVWPVYSN